MEYKQDMNILFVLYISCDLISVLKCNGQTITLLLILKNKQHIFHLILK